MLMSTTGCTCTCEKTAFCARAGEEEGEEEEGGGQVGA
jgi:hypothetical protein